VSEAPTPAINAAETLAVALCQNRALGLLLIDGVTQRVARMFTLIGQLRESVSAGNAVAAQKAVEEIMAVNALGDLAGVFDQREMQG
jgi:hypothetical protein